MKIRKTIITFICISILTLSFTVFGQETLPVGKCEIRDAGFGKPKEPPVIFGKPYTIPDLRLQIIDNQTSKPIVNNKVYFRYVWNWYDFSDRFDGRRNGVWREAYDVMLCGTDETGVIFIPKREIQPVGYNQGKRIFFWLKDTPNFDHIEISIHLNGYISAYQYSKKSIDKLKRENSDLLTFNVSRKSPLE